MSDFRQELYFRYISTFKGYDKQPNYKELQYLWAWYKRVYLHLFSGLNLNAAVLELGCGPGHMLQFLKSRGFTNIIGIDISKEQIALAVDKGLDATVEDAFDFLDASENRFEAIIAIDFLEHFTKGEMLQLVSLVQKALRPSGIFVAQTPNGQGLFPNQIIYGDLTHLTIFNPGSLRQLLRLTGFDDIVFIETASYDRGLVGRIRSLAWQIIKIAANIIRKIETGKTQDIWTENLICCCRKRDEDEGSCRHL